MSDERHDNRRNDLCACGDQKPARCPWEIEAGDQMAEKLRAQMALKAIVVALALDFASLGNGWTEATQVILARIETLVDEAERAFVERDEIRASSPVFGEAR